MTYCFLISVYNGIVDIRMKFHPNKCKIVSINNFYENLFEIQELPRPLYYYSYQLCDIIFYYSTTEKDRRIITTPKF